MNQGKNRKDYAGMDLNEIPSLSDFQNYAEKSSKMEGMFRMLVSNLPLINNKVTSLTDLQNRALAQKNSNKMDDNEFEVDIPEPNWNDLTPPDGHDHAPAQEIKENIENLAPISFNFDEFLSMNEADVNKFRDHRGFNALMLAAEAGRLDVVQNLIDRGEEVDFEVDGESAIGLAHKGGHQEIVLALLKANAKFPENFSWEAASGELKTFIDLSEGIHKKVKDVNDDLNNVKTYLREKIEANSNLRYFYEPRNCSLLKCAILCKRFLIYEFLIFLNIFLAPHESMDEINESLSNRERKKLSDINFRISPSLMTEPMMILMRNTKLSPDSPKDRQGEFIFFIRQAFDDLFMIPATAIILKIVAASRNFKIIFDFKRDSVTFLDPKSEPFCEGLMYLNGKIYIGAKDLLDAENDRNVIGTIAHELCHYAMFLCFQNHAKPYKKKDANTEVTFNAISQECERVKESEELIDLVYDCYDEDMWHAELIVRVPHMIAVYFKNQQALQRLGRIFQNLFVFYHQSCMPGMEAELPRIEREFSPMKKVEEKVKRQKFFNLILLASIVLGTFLSSFIIYWALPVAWSELDTNDRETVKNSTVKFYGVDVKFGELFANDSEAYYLLSSEQIKKALKGDTEEISKALNLTLHPYVFLTWSNMTQKMRENFLLRKVDFQGQSVPFGDITKDSSLKLLHTNEIKIIFTESSFKVSSVVEEKSKIFIERYFTDQYLTVIGEQVLKALIIYQEKGYHKFYKDSKIDIDDSKVTSFEQIVDHIQSSKIFLLSSAAGDGKSTTFRHYSSKLKEKFPQKWIQFVDLKKHFEVFDKAQSIDFNDQTLLMNFLGEKVLALERFELDVFKELFASEKVIFLWDGVDEIAPRFKSFMLNLSENIFKTKNFQMISTRPQHSKDFEEKFNVKALKLIPFSEFDRFELLVKTVADVKFNEHRPEIYEEHKKFYNLSYANLNDLSLKQNASKYLKPLARAYRIFDASETVAGASDSPSESFVSNPLLVSMISEISCDENFEVDFDTDVVNHFDLYKIFVIKKLKIIRTKGDEVESDRDEVISNSLVNIWQVHQFFALDLITRASNLSESHAIEASNYIRDKIEESLKFFSGEQISRFGILQVQSESDFDFAHRSFAEFFVAQFFLDNVFLRTQRRNVNEAYQKWKISFLFELHGKGNQFFTFFRGAQTHEIYKFVEDPSFSSEFFKSALKQNLSSYETILRFIYSIEWPYDTLATILHAFYDEMKLRHDLDSFQFMKLDYYVLERMKHKKYSNITQNIKIKFEKLREELKEISAKGLEECGMKIRKDDYEEIIEWSKTFTYFGESFEIALPDLIKAAYSNDLEEFQNLFQFMGDLPHKSELAVGLPVLYEEMKLTNGLENFKVMLLYYLIKERMEEYIYRPFFTFPQEYQDKLEALREVLDNEKEKIKQGVEECGVSIRSGDYQKLTKWSKGFTYHGECFEYALPDLIKAAYSSDLNDIFNIHKFIADCNRATHLAVGFLSLYKEIKLRNDFQSLYIMILDYEAKGVINDDNYTSNVKYYKNIFDTLSTELSEKSLKAVEEYATKIRNGDYKEIFERAEFLSYGHSGLMLALPDLIKSAHSTNFTEYLNVFGFIDQLPWMQQKSVGISALYNVMKSKNYLESFKLMMIHYLVKEKMINPYYEVLSQEYAEIFETLTVELGETSLRRIKECGSEIRSDNYKQIIQWIKILSYFKSFELVIDDIIKYAYSNDFDEFINVLKFINDVPSYIIKTRYCLPSLYNVIKMKNDLDDFQLAIVYYSVEAVIVNDHYSDVEEEYKAKLEVIKNELKENSRKGIEAGLVMIRNGKYQKFDRWNRISLFIPNSIQLALPDLINSACSNNLNCFEDIVKFVDYLSVLDYYVLAYPIILKELVLNDSIESSKGMILAYSLKRFMYHKTYPQNAQELRDEMESFKEDLPLNIRNLIFNSRESCSIKNKWSSENLILANNGSQVFTSLQEDHLNSTWSIQIDNFANNFTIKFKNESFFLTVQENISSNNRRHVFIKQSNETNEEFYWQIIPNNNETFLILNAKLNEYLIASELRLNGEGHEVFTSNVNEVSDKGAWEIKCIT